MMAKAWTRCSSCKEPIAHGASYYVCSVSTCNRKRTGMVFCTVSCWEAHLPLMRHKDAGAVEHRAPAEGEAEVSETGSRDAPSRRRVVAVESAPGGGDPSPGDAAFEVEDDDLPRDVLVVVSKLKKYIRARSGMNTSDHVTEVLSDHLRSLCDEAIRNAGRDGRRTVLDRDIPEPPRAPAASGVKTE